MAKTTINSIRPVNYIGSGHIVKTMCLTLQQPNMLMVSRNGTKSHALIVNKEEGIESSKQNNE